MPANLTRGFRIRISQACGWVLFLACSANTGYAGWCDLCEELGESPRPRHIPICDPHYGFYSTQWRSWCGLESGAYPMRPSAQYPIPPAPLHWQTPTVGSSHVPSMPHPPAVTAPVPEPSWMPSPRVPAPSPVISPPADNQPREVQPALTPVSPNAAQPSLVLPPTTQSDRDYRSSRVPAIRQVSGQEAADYPGRYTNYRVPSQR